MEIPNTFYRVSAKALILDEEKRFLLIKEKTDYFNGWDMPGGGLDWGEGAQEGIAREIKEEMGLTVISVADIPSYFISAFIERANTWIVNVFYRVEIENLNFTPSDECVEIKFFTTEDVLNARQGAISENVIEFAKQYKQ